MGIKDIMYAVCMPEFASLVLTYLMLTTLDESNVARGYGCASAPAGQLHLCWMMPSKAID